MAEMQGPFGIGEGNNKELSLQCPLIHDRKNWLTVDFDDIDRYAVSCNTLKIITILNEHWDDPKYAPLNPEPYDESEDEDDAYDRRKALIDKRITAAMGR